MANISKVKTTDGVVHDLEVDLSNYYTKSEVDASEALKADADSVYTKAQTDNLLGTKANASDVYDKLAIDTALAFKADKVDTYTKSETVNAIESELADYTTASEVASDLTSLSAAQSEVDSLQTSEMTSLSVTQSLQTSEIASLSTAESELGSEVTVIGSEVTSISTDLGSTPLETTAQNVHDAINELNSEVKDWTLIHFFTAQVSTEVIDFDPTEYNYKDLCFVFRNDAQSTVSSETLPYDVFVNTLKRVDMIEWFGSTSIGVRTLLLTTNDTKLSYHSDNNVSLRVYGR